jgi:hypothetical protein
LTKGAKAAVETRSIQFGKRSSGAGEYFRQLWMGVFSFSRKTTPKTAADRQRCQILFERNAIWP